MIGLRKALDAGRLTADVLLRPPVRRTLPVVALFFALQRYIVSGLTVGGVKG